MPYPFVRPAPDALQTPFHDPTQGEPLCGVVVAMPPGDRAHSPPIARATRAQSGSETCRRELDNAVAVSNLAHTWMKTRVPPHHFLGRDEVGRFLVAAPGGHHDRHAENESRRDGRATPRLRTYARPTRKGERLVAGEQRAERQARGQAHTPEQHDDHDPVEHTRHRTPIRDAAHGASRATNLATWRTI